MSEAMNYERARWLVAKARERLELDLSGMVVLTEAATRYYALSPLIGAQAGAEKVYCLASDTRYGSADEAVRQVLALAEQWDVRDVVEILDDREDTRLENVNIITNLGAVRPIDRQLLEAVSSVAAVSLMWETWEHREADVNLKACREMDVPVGGTNEAAPSVRTKDYLGPLALKLLFECHIEGYRSKVLVVGGKDFGEPVAGYLSTTGVDVVRLDPSEGWEQGGGEPEELERIVSFGADAIVVAEHRDPVPLLGPGALIEPNDILRMGAGVSVVHICGEVDQTALLEAGINCVPDRFSSWGHMSVTTAYLGPRPLVDLHSAGLKVGQEMISLKKEERSAVEVERILSEKSRLVDIFD